MISVPSYQVIDVVGKGGFGVVYRARQLTIDREVAIKVDSRVILDERDQRRFLREVRAAGRLSGHPNVVEIYDAGVLADGRPYIVMELCPGGSLAGRAPMPPAEVAAIGYRIADALAAAHELGVLHRDIKPGNILLKRYGTVALGDFGLAALIETGRDSSVTLSALTPAYAPPEAFLMRPPTPGSDIYALGATLYALLAGRPPRFPANGEPSLPEILRLHDQPVPDLPTVPGALTGALRTALAKDPDRRFPNARAFWDALGAPTEPGTGTVTVPRPAAGVPATRPGRRRGVPLAGVLGLVVVLALVGIWFATRRSQTAGGGAVGATGMSGATDGAIAASDGLDRYGVHTSTKDCPAAAVAAGQARCVERAECWSGMVVINGEVTSIRPLPCDQAHVFETYAIALVPAGLATDYEDVLAADPTVAEVCSTDTLLASRHGKARDIAADRWTAAILPPTPDDRAAKRHVYRCVATVTGDEAITGTAFRPVR